MVDHERYDIRKDPDGTYSVYDVASGETVVLNGVLQVGFDVQDADDIAECLESIARITAGRGTNTKQ